MAVAVRVGRGVFVSVAVGGSAVSVGTAVNVAEVKPLRRSIVSSSDRVRRRRELDVLVDLVLLEWLIDMPTEIRAGKDRKFQFLVGQVMKETKGKGDPKLVTDLMRDRDRVREVHLAQL